MLLTAGRQVAYYILKVYSMTYTYNVKLFAFFRNAGITKKDDNPVAYFTLEDDW